MNGQIDVMGSFYMWSAFASNDTFLCLLYEHSFWAGSGKVEGREVRNYLDWMDGMDDCNGSR